MRSDKNDWSGAIRLHPTDLKAQLETGLPRHLDIEKNEVEMFPHHEALRGQRIIQAFDMKASFSQRGADDFAGNNFVLHHSNLRRRRDLVLRIRDAINQQRHCLNGVRDRSYNRRRDLYRLAVQFDEQPFQSCAHLRDLLESKTASATRLQTKLTVHLEKRNPTQIFPFRPGEILITVA